jgi:4-amino-4-deoxychorismate lyase
MYPLIETLCLKNGKLLNEDWHRLRFNRSFREFYGISPEYDLIEGISIPPDCSNGIYKLRIKYNISGKSADFEEYSFKRINSLKTVEDNLIDYRLKFSDRTDLNRLRELRAGCDDILIIKNGMVTDTSSCNIVFFDGSAWHTPSTPLLKGTARERLIESGRIREREIKFQDLSQYKSFRLINAMRDFDSLDDTDISNIRM